MTHVLSTVGSRSAGPNDSDVSGKEKPNLIIVMGVCGSGKSTLAKAIADHFGYRFLDADDYHSEEAKLRMGSGIPLTDEMRKPWVRSICGHLRQLSYLDVSCTLAFSGLRKEHRQKMRDTGHNVIFLFLNGDKALIRRRMQSRPGHFMPPKLIDSQFDALERPQGETDVFSIDIEPPMDKVTEKAIALVNEAFHLS